MSTTQPTPSLSELDARVLHATPARSRSASLIADRAGCLPDVALSTLRRLRGRGLVEDDGYRPPREWIRSHHGDAAMEFVPRPRNAQTWGQAARERDLLRASVELAIQSSSRPGNCSRP